MTPTVKSPARRLAVACAVAVLATATLQAAPALADTATSANLQREVAVAHILQFSTGVLVTMSDGSFEQVRKGIYRHVDAKGQVIEIRTAVPTDTSRLLAM